MDNQLLIIVGGAVALLMLAAGLIGLMRQCRQLKLQLQLLEKKIQRSGDDVAGLCSAAVAVDQRLAASEARLYQLMDNINQSAPPQAAAVEPDEPAEAQGYALAIEKIQRGASVDELVKSCALTRDEAMLLMRLHGGSR